MKLLTIEPTPSPNVMKLNLDEQLPVGIQKTYTKDQVYNVPPKIRKLLDIEGVKEIFQTLDFIALERVSGADWKRIIDEASTVLEAEEGTSFAAEAEQAHTYGEARVYVQVFRKIPMQIRVRAAQEEARIALPERFVQAAMKAGAASPNLIRERKLVDYGIRYGDDLNEIAEEILVELDAAYDQERIDKMVTQILEKHTEEPEAPVVWTEEEIHTNLEHTDWKIRFAALERLYPTIEELPYIAKALDDQNTSIRRLATVYLGELEDPITIPYLEKALVDTSPPVRRTAGDCLSDLGDPSSIDAMAKALQDRSKIVRWRAARYLYEVGDETALEALKQAENDSEFEVSLQIKMAIERIESGEEAAGTIWQQMTRSRQQNS